MSNTLLSVIGGLALWVLFVIVVCRAMSINKRSSDQRAESVPYILHESQPMPLDSAYVRGVQAATRHVRAGSIE